MWNNTSQFLRSRLELKTRQRIAISLYFFLSGLCFASWTSRIPTIKDALQINDAELGSLLFIMPVSQLAGLPLSAWLSAKFETRWPSLIGMVLQTVSLVLIGISNTILALGLSMFSFAFFMRIFNIAMNAQAITLQKQYTKRINGAFHGMWSFGGIVGVGLTSLMIAVNIGIHDHLLFIAILTVITGAVVFKYLIRGDKSSTGNSFKLKRPDQQMLLLGMLVLLAAVCEGGMFDWSGIYFKDVVKVEIFTAGYLIFMTCMALSRFISDFIIKHIGMRSMYALSALLMSLGLLMSVIFPNFYMAMVGFSMVGIGTASIFPMTFLLAGTSQKFTPSVALSIVVTYAMIGVLLGPVVIGYIAHNLHLRVSFVFLALTSLAIIPVSRWYFSRFPANY